MAYWSWAKSRQHYISRVEIVQSLHYRLASVGKAGASGLSSLLPAEIYGQNVVYWLIRMKSFRWCRRFRRFTLLVKTPEQSTRLVLGPLYMIWAFVTCLQVGYTLLVYTIYPTSFEHPISVRNWKNTLGTQLPGRCLIFMMTANPMESSANTSRSGESPRLGSKIHFWTWS